MYRILIVLLFAVILDSCSVQKITGSYERKYSICDGAFRNYRVETIDLKDDSSYTIVTKSFGSPAYKSLLYSSVSKGSFTVNNRNIFLKPTGLDYYQFCLRQKSDKLLILDCKSGKKIHSAEVYKKSDVNNGN